MQLFPDAHQVTVEDESRMLCLFQIGVAITAMGTGVAYKDFGQ